MFKRYLLFPILQQLNHKNAIVITGMRQVGKTTLMKQLTEYWKGKNIWFDFDNPLDFLVFENNDYKAIYEDLRRQAGTVPGERFLVCIDEIQNFPEVTKVIKYLIDHYKVKFIITGSSNYYLRNLFPESLSGRKFLFVLRPLSYKEYLHFHGELTEKEMSPDLEEALKPNSKAMIQKRRILYDEYLEYGGFPEVAITDNTETKHLILKNIFSSFFEKDIKVFSELKDVRELRDLIILLGPRNGNILNVTRLASELGVNRVKVYSYLEFLEGTFFMKLIPKFSNSVDRSVAGGKKLYFSDTGMLNLISRTSQGQLLETAVANQIQHYGSVSYYNKRNSAEIDFILDNSIALEVKQKALTTDLQKLNKNAESIGLSKLFMISNTYVDIENVVFPWML